MLENQMKNQNKIKKQQGAAFGGAPRALPRPGAVVFDFIFDCLFDFSSMWQICLIFYLICPSMLIIWQISLIIFLFSFWFFFKMAFFRLCLPGRSQPSPRNEKYANKK